MKLDYDLGQMKSENGTALRYEVEELASSLAFLITQKLEERSAFKKLDEIINNEKLKLYFHVLIKKEIYSTIIYLCVLRWYKRNSQTFKDSNQDVNAPNTGIFPLLREIWPDSRFPIELYNEKTIDMKRILSTIIKASKKSLKYIFFWCDSIFNRIYHKKYFANLVSNKNNIALEYNEGIDTNHRSDISWLQEEYLQKDKIIVYFTSKEHKNGKCIEDNVIKKIEQLGMKAICLKRGIMTQKSYPVWYPTSEKFLSYPYITIYNCVDKWLNTKGKNFINEINFWVSFYKKFNIRINFITGEGDPKYIAQKIAFECSNTQTGILVRKQRSELFLPFTMFPGHHPVHTFFIFNSRSVKYLKPNTNDINTALVSGHSSDYVVKHLTPESLDLKRKLKLHGVKYTMALFDNIHGNIYGFSTIEMKNFYNTFLDMLFRDPTIGIIIKSKKPIILNSMPIISQKIEKAQSTGRCIKLSNEFGRFPLDAALASDISVGVGISSAIIEIATAGQPAVMYDMTTYYPHEFYKKGKNKIIFDDLELLVGKIKDHKNNNLNSNLGQWADLKIELDPFSDGMSNYRVEEYLKNCLDAFDLGLNASDVINNANKKYSENWGYENVHEF